jgi:hypothetical protein
MIVTSFYWSVFNFLNPEYSIEIPSSKRHHFLSHIFCVIASTRMYIGQLIWILYLPTGVLGTSGFEHLSARWQEYECVP